MIIGREPEKKLLEDVWSSSRAQFVTVYGRRRIGKIYLIDQFFKVKNCTFMQATGIIGGSMKEQLNSFTEAFSETFF